ncbi:hypothetical protein DPMN_083006, partial [Dreissena polymorpha]
STTLRVAATEWEYVSLGLTALLVVSVVVIIVTCTCLLKMRRKLNKCNATLYPMSTSADKKNTSPGMKQQSGKLELTEMSRDEGHVEDVIDSPILPSTPLRSLAQPLTVNANSRIDVNKAPPLPNRTKRAARPTASHSSNSKLSSNIPTRTLTANREPKQRRSSNESNVNTETRSESFAVKDDMKHRGSIDIQFNERVKFEASGLYEDQDEDNLYEEYQNMTLRYNDKPYPESDEKKNVSEDNGVYEEPYNTTEKRASSASEAYLQKQNTMSGLPAKDQTWSTIGDITSSLPLQVSEALTNNWRSAGLSVLPGKTKTSRQTANEDTNPLNVYDDLTTIHPSNSSITIGTHGNNNSFFFISDETRTNTDINQEQDNFEENVVYEDELLSSPDEIYTIPVSNVVFTQGTHVEDVENDLYLFEKSESDMYADYASPQTVALYDTTRIKGHTSTQDIQNDQYANAEIPKASVLEIYAVTGIEQEPASHQRSHQTLTSNLLYKDSPSKKASEKTCNEFSETMVPLSSSTGGEEQTQSKSYLMTPILKVSDMPTSAPNDASPDMVLDQFEQEESIAPPNTPPPELPIETSPSVPDNETQELPMVPPRRTIMTPVFNGHENVESLIKQSNVDLGRTNVLLRNIGDELPIMPSPVTCEPKPSNGEGHRYAYYLDVNDQQNELLDSGEVVKNNDIQESDGYVEGNESEQTYDIPTKFKHGQSMS